jgi:hypothetical protein
MQWANETDGGDCAQCIGLFYRTDTSWASSPSASSSRVGSHACSELVLRSWSGEMERKEVLLCALRSFLVLGRNAVDGVGDRRECRSRDETELRP